MTKGRCRHTHALSADMDLRIAGGRGRCLRREAADEAVPPDQEHPCPAVLTRWHRHRHKPRKGKDHMLDTVAAIVQALADTQVERRQMRTQNREFRRGERGQKRVSLVGLCQHGVRLLNPQRRTRAPSARQFRLSKQCASAT